MLEYLEFVDDVLDELDSRERGRIHPDDARARHRRRSPARGLRENRRSEEGRRIHDRGDRRLDFSRRRFKGSRVQRVQGLQFKRMLTTFDKDLAPGARNAIRVCLNVQPHERVTVITDRDCDDIAASLVHEIEEVGAPYKAFILEDVAPAAARRSARRRSPTTWSRARSASSPCTCSATSSARACSSPTSSIAAGCAMPTWSTSTAR